MYDPESQLRAIIDASKHLIAPDGLDGVEHYYGHSEFGMALEGLILELISSGKYPDEFSFPDWMELATYYGLNIDPVFDGEFWGKFEKWGRSHARPTGE